MATRSRAAPLLLRASRQTSRIPARTLGILRRKYATEHPPPPPPPSRPRPESKGLAANFYRSFGSPILKTFLGALFTYQVLYWSWLKLEAVEEKYDKENEISGLETQLKSLKDGGKIEGMQGPVAVGVPAAEGSQSSSQEGWSSWAKRKVFGGSKGS
ncbi:hypothetical protein BDV96DRAFT_580603 [Lophiotrema nucula]|uniref:Inner membrane assembly complex subunit 17 n=1 Tax=Lophiotrema nucula TaxID=690887 RepID=A0A6A5Z1T7_9PLEO|nr:hypothetical protein BDV96DRAFT_580603 [Lophiotrema nucula]